MRNLRAVHKDLVIACFGIRDVNRLDIVTGVEFIGAQAWVAGGINALVAVVMDAIRAHHFQIQIVDQCFCRRRLTGEIGPGQGDGDWANGRARRYGRSWRGCG